MAVPSVPSGVEVETSLEGGAGIFEGNETQISQMILNLVLNGFQAMEEKGGTLKVSTYSTEELVVISVQDEGMGIPKEHVKNIYEPFFTTKETGKGTGLGLAIVQQVVSEHQGHIRLNTKEGKGSVFIVEFPRKK